jgi:hypothetical protein
MFRRTLFSVPPPLLAAPRTMTRNDAIARREALAREEARLSQRIDALRGEMDDLSNQLHGGGPSPPIPPRPSPPPGQPPPPPGLRETKSLTTIEFINAGRRAQNLPPLTANDIIEGPPQPQRVAKIDAAATAAAIIRAGQVARGELPTPIPPKDSVAYKILRAGAIARNEPFPE